MKNFIFLLLIVFLGCSNNSDLGSNSNVPLKNNVPVKITEQIENQNSTDNEIQELKSFSPKDIVEYLNNNDDEKIEFIWQHFNIAKNDEESDYYQFSDGFGNYNADEISFDLNGDNEKDTVLKIYGGGLVRYLLFIKLQNDFTYAGHSDVLETRWTDPTFRVINIKDKFWFAVNQAGGGGTDVSLQVESWIPIKAGNSDEALLYISKGHDTDSRINGSIWDRHFKSELKQQKFIDGKYILEFETEVDFRISKGTTDIRNFLKNQKAVYVLNETSGEFVLDEKNSTITEDELENVFNYEEPLGIDKFIKYYFSELKNIARNGTKTQKEWLARLISEFPQAEGIEELKSEIN